MHLWDRLQEPANALVCGASRGIELARPFRRNVPVDKLFGPAFAAARLLEQVERHGPPQSGSFWTWDGQPIEW